MVIEVTPSSFKRVGVVYNPASRGGQSDGIFKFVVKPLLEKYLGERLFKCVPTECVGDGTRCAFELVASDGCDLIITCGGDGSTYNAINGVVRGCLFLDPEALTKGAPLPVAFAVIPTGSGNDLHKTITSEPVNTKDLAFFENMVKIIAQTGRVIDCDIGRVDYTKDTTGIISQQLNDEHIPKQYLSNDSSKKLAYQLDTSNTGVRFYMNESSFGISSAVLNSVNNSSISKEINYNIQTLWKQVSYVNPSVKIEVDGETVADGICQLVCVGNGRCFGNGMQINPNAKLTSESLSVCILHNVRLWNAPYIIYQIQNGTHGDNALASIFDRTKTISAVKNDSTVDEVYLECDGEVVGKLPARYSVVPAILKFIVPETSPEFENHTNKN